MCTVAPNCKLLHIDISDNFLDFNFKFTIKSAWKRLNKTSQCHGQNMGLKDVTRHIDDEDVEIWLLNYFSLCNEALLYNQCNLTIS